MGSFSVFYIPFSFFGQQDGDFCLVVRAIQAVSHPGGGVVKDAVSQQGLGQQQQRGASGEGDDDEDEDEGLQKSTGITVSGSGRSSSSRGSGTITRGSWWRRGVFCGLL